MNNRKLAIISLILLIVLDSFVVADNIIPAYIRGREKETTYNFVFNFTSDITCNNVLKEVTATITTDINGIGFASLDISDLTIPPSYMCEYQNGVLIATHIWNDVITPNIITDKLIIVNRASIPLLNITKIISSRVNLTPSATSTPTEITFAGSGATTLTLEGDLSVKGGDCSCNQNLGRTASPTFRGMTLDMSQDYNFTERAGAFAIQGQTSGGFSSYDFFTKDGDGTDAIYLQFWAKGTPTSITNSEWVGFYYDPSTRTFDIRSRNLGSGTLLPIRVYTIGNTNQLKLDTGGEVYMAQAVDDALGNLRDTKWDSATGQIGYDSSSIRHKENIEDMPDEVSEKIYDLRPVTFDKIGGAKEQIGLTAEEVNELFPQCVFYKRQEIWGICEDEQFGDYECITSYRLEIDKTTGKKIPEGINYGCLISPLIQEVQKLKKEIDILKK